MSDILIFQNPQFGEIRTAGTADHPMFCLADVCKALELNNPSQVKSRLNPNGIQLIDIQALYNKEGVSIKQLGNTMTNFINESNLYKCIFQSRTEQAESFQDWVTGDVIPSIRRAGGYMVAKEDETAEEFMARALVLAQDTLKRRNERIMLLEKQNEALQAENEELRVKSDYVEKILASKELVTITQIAADYGMSAKAFNKKLAELKVQRKVNGQWILYAPHSKQGYVHSRTINITHRDGSTGSVMHTEWRQKGRLFLYETLKKNGILPLIERA